MIYLIASSQQAAFAISVTAKIRAQQITHFCRQLRRKVGQASNETPFLSISQHLFLLSVNQNPNSEDWLVRVINNGQQNNGIKITNNWIIINHNLGDQMKFSLSFPQNGTTKTVEIKDPNSWRNFLERRISQEVQADSLGDEFKGYVFKITGGYDHDGFAMKQGIMKSSRVRLLLKPGAQGYRCKRSGERKRKSVRGCIVGPDINMLSCVVVKKGDKEIPGLTDVVKARRLGPKRASGIRKLFSISKAEGEKAGNATALVKKNVIRRTFQRKKEGGEGGAQRSKAPRIQRLITEVRIRRKRIQKEDKIKRSKKTATALQEYKTLYQKWITKKKAAANQMKQARKDSQSGKKSSEEKNKSAEKKPTETKKKDEPKKVETKKVDPTKAQQPKKPEQHPKKAEHPKKTEPKKVDPSKPAKTQQKKTENPKQQETKPAAQKKK